MQRLFIQLFGMFYKILKIHNCEDKKGKFFLKGRTNTLKEGGQEHKVGIKGKRRLNSKDLKSPDDHVKP